MVSKKIRNYWHGPLMTRIYTCVDTGYIIGMNSRIDMGDTEISLVQSLKMIYKESG